MAENAEEDTQPAEEDTQPEGGPSDSLSHLEPAAGGKSKRNRKHKVLVEQARRLASKSIPWRSLPYLREAALADIRVVAKLYGGDLLDISPGGVTRRVLLELERSARAIGEHSCQPLAALFEQAV